MLLHSHNTAVIMALLLYIPDVGSVCQCSPQGHNYGIMQFPKYTTIHVYNCERSKP